MDVADPVRGELRTALYQHAFNPTRPAEPGSASAQILDWAQQASLPVGCLSEPAVLRTALEALRFRLDGSRAAANTIIRKRAVLHGALATRPSPGCCRTTRWTVPAAGVPRSSVALDPAVVASPAQVAALLDAVARRPYDLRHAALSLWLNSGGDPAQIAARPGTASRSCSPSTPTASTATTTCSTSRLAASSDRPKDVVRARPRKSQRFAPTARLGGKTSGCTDRDERGRRPPCVRDFPARPADSPQITPTAGHPGSPIDKRLASSKPNLKTPARHPAWPTDGPRTARTGTQKPVPPSDSTGFDLRKRGGRCWVRTNVG